MGAPALAPARPPRRRPAQRRPTRRAPARRAPSDRGRARRSPNRALALQGRAAGRPPRRRAQIAQPALAGAALIPSAAVRTAGAVRDLSDSSLIVRLTSGRGWIAVLCALLGGIVALNVISLSLNAGSGRVSQQIEELERANSALRAELAEQVSASEVEAAAVRLGLAVPNPDDVNYLKAGERDLDRLAALLRNQTVLTDSVPDVVTAPDPVPYAAPVAPTPTSTTSPAPAPAPAQPAPVPAAPPGGGGVGL